MSYLRSSTSRQLNWSERTDRVARRIRQGLRALGAADYPNRDATLRQMLTPKQVHAFRALSPHDQAHLLRVYDQLRNWGVTDPDLLLAGLLHDVGKVTTDGRVRLVDRVAFVLLGNAGRRWATLPAPAWRQGLAIAANHASLGATRAAELGCSPRVCWLIARHHDRNPDDAGLRLLQAADRVN